MSPGLFTFFCLKNQSVTQLEYDQNGVSLLTAYSVLPQGIVFATDHEEIMCIPPVLNTLVVLAHPTFGRCICQTMCSNDAFLFFFNENGVKCVVWLAAHA